ncbi:cytochrome P450 [Sphaerisporangium melleum]|uniref:Cytochrome P450 n=1 Tax=Sphaerisporangium melleum TaxID=321316 RepID=A0A917VME4_9ACTN|nr:cytochrome P450 [Sphaerisporangium melleum]GGK95746.1 cytochrome P450 [Sphaerisporangium melleum]GII70640.1 cytochrome P450 [Sphaerisporangium melleum]
MSVLRDAVPIAHPFDQDAEGVNRPGLYKNDMYHRVRESGTGVAEVVRANGTRAKLVTRYDDVTTVLRDQETFSRKAALDVDDVDLEGTLLGLDSGEHAAVRDVVKDRFTPQAVAALQAAIEERAAGRLKEMLAAGAPADLIDAFALPLALDTIADLLGLPDGDRSRFREWGEAFLATSAASRADAAASQLAMAGYLAELLERRRAEPGPDLLSRIAAAAGALPPDRVIKLPIALLVGGWETVAASIGTFAEVLLTHPYGGHDTAYAYLATHPGAVPGAVAELERMFSTTAADEMPRRVVRDATLPSGARLRAGEVVIPSHDAANFDPRVFPDPHRMDFGRSPNRHLSFGYGAHHCIGRHLGHDQVIAAITLLVREVPGLRLAVPAGQVPRRTGHAISGPTHLAVAWS